MFSFNPYDRVTSSLILTTILDVQRSRDLYFLKTDNFIVNDRISYLGIARGIGTLGEKLSEGVLLASQNLTLTALSTIDNGVSVIQVLLDLSAAFDTVNHGLFLSRLSTRYGL